MASAELHQLLIRSAVIHRSDAAFDWLLAVVAAGSRTKAGLVIEELAAYRSRDGLRKRLERVLEERGDAGLGRLFAKHWERD